MSNNQWHRPPAQLEMEHEDTIDASQQKKGGIY